MFIALVIVTLLQSSQEKETESLIRNLDHEDVQVRSRSIELLLNRGESVRKDLLVASERGTLQVRLESISILAGLDRKKAQDAARREAKLLTLSIRDQTLKTVACTIEELSGEKLLLLPEISESRVNSLECRNMPYWQVIDLLCAQSGVSALRERSPVVLSSRKSDPELVAYSGPIRVGLVTLRKGSAADGAYADIKFSVTWQSDVAAYWSGLRVVGAEDTVGSRLRATPSDVLAPPNPGVRSWSYVEEKPRMHKQGFHHWRLSSQANQMAKLSKLSCEALLTLPLRKTDVALHKSTGFCTEIEGIAFSLCDEKPSNSVDDDCYTTTLSLVPRRANIHRAAFVTSLRYLKVRAKKQTGEWEIGNVKCVGSSVDAAFVRLSFSGIRAHEHPVEIETQIICETFLDTYQVTFSNIDLR